MLLSDIAEKYITFNVYNTHTITTIRTCCDLFDRRSGITDIKKLEPEHIANFRRNTLEKANQFTYNGYLGHIKMVARWGAEQGFFKAEYILLLKKISEPEVIPKTIASDDLREVLHQLDTVPKMITVAWFWVIAIRFLSGTGVRRRQLVALKYGDIDWEAKLLTLRFESSKNKRSWKIPLLDWVLADLEILVVAIEKVLDRPIHNNDRLFNICYFNSRCEPDNEDSTKMKATYVSQIMKKITKESGVKIGAHKLRHTVATNLCNPLDPDDSPDIFFAQHVLGHKEISSTRIYVQTRVEHRHAYMGKLLRNTLGKNHGKFLTG